MRGIGRWVTIAGVLAAVVLLVQPADAGSFEDGVRARWRGAWVVIDTEIYSSCSGRHDVNKLNGTLVTNRGGHRFLPGELGKIDRVQVKKKKVELMTTLAVPLLVSHQDGPFTLYDDRVCAVSLEILLPRELTKTKDIEGVDRIAAGVARRFDTREAALVSGGWNGREQEPYPADYDLTLARHSAWKAEQHNLAVDDKKYTAIEQVKTTGRTIDDDPDYLAGFAAGVDTMRRWREQDCGRLVARNFEQVRQRAPEEHRADTDEEKEWREGYDDGQRLLYNIAVMERIEACYVDVPPVPETTSGDLTSATAPAGAR